MFYLWLYGLIEMNWGSGGRVNANTTVLFVKGYSYSHSMRMSWSGEV